MTNEEREALIRQLHANHALGSDAAFLLSALDEARAERDSLAARAKVADAIITAAHQPDREALGRMVRRVWVEWAAEQPSPKPSWLVPWEGLSEPDREVDMRIGEALVSTPRAERDEARGQLAALHAAWANVLHCEVKSVYGGGGYEQRSLWGLRDAFADTAAAAKAHEARMREPVERERDAAIARAETAEARAEKAEAAVDAQAEILQESRQCVRTMDAWTHKHEARMRSMLVGAGDLVDEMTRLGLALRTAIFRSVADAKNKARDERDTLAAALAEHRRTVADVLAEPHAYIGARERAVLDALAASPVDLAAQRDARVREKTLREAADDIRALAPWAHASTTAFELWLRKRADEAEKGGAR